MIITAENGYSGGGFDCFLAYFKPYYDKDICWESLENLKFEENFKFRNCKINGQSLQPPFRGKPPLLLGHEQLDIHSSGLSR